MFSWLKKRKRSDLVCQLYTDKLEGNVDSILQWYAKKNLYSLVLKKKKKRIYNTQVFLGGLWQSQVLSANFMT